jgi:cobalamin biosynthesis protein CobD/CbiB
MKRFFQPTPVMRQDSPTLRGVFWILTIATAATQVLCALGSGSPDTAQPLADWVNTTANLLNILIALLVLVPATRFWGALAAAIIMTVSTITNFQVDGYAYFLKVLPFDVLAFALAAVVAWHHRGDVKGGA